MLGARAASVLRPGAGAQFAGGTGGVAADRSCMESKNRFAVDRRTNAEPSVRRRPSHSLDSLRQWLEATLSTLSRKSETTVAIRYALARWDALTRYIEDGHIEIDNNAAERSLRGVALGRNYVQSAIMCSW